MIPMPYVVGTIPMKPCPPKWANTGRKNIFAPLLVKHQKTFLLFAEFRKQGNSLGNFTDQTWSFGHLSLSLYRETAKSTASPEEKTAFSHKSRTSLQFFSCTVDQTLTLIWSKRAKSRDHQTPRLSQPHWCVCRFYD